MLNIKEIVGKLLGSILLVIGFVNILVAENTRIIMNTTEALKPIYPGFSGTSGLNYAANWNPLVFPIILCIIGVFLLAIRYNEK